MISFIINDMTCGHCVGSVTKAVQATDRSAQVQVNLAEHRVDIAAAQASAGQFKAAIEAAGFTPEAAGAA